MDATEHEQTSAGTRQQAMNELEESPCSHQETSPYAPGQMIPRAMGVQEVASDSAVISPSNAAGARTNSAGTKCDI